MRLIRLRRWYRLAAPGAALCSVGACLGPNPGFFIGSTAASAAISSIVGSALTTIPNAVISTLVSFFLNGLLGLGGG